MAEEIDKNEEPQNEARDFSQLSDEEILELSPEEISGMTGNQEQSDEEEEVQEKAQEENEVVKAQDQTFTDEGTDDEATTETLNAEPETKQAEEEAEEDTKSTEKVEKTEKIDYKAEYEKLLAPFNANGKQTQVKNVDEAIKLMQMGVGFHTKMNALKDLKRKIQPLEDHNLLNEDNVNFFIDLVGKKDQNAIKKLLSDAKVDPIDIDLDNDSSEYKPNTYTVDDARLELDDILETLKTSTHYTNILDIVGNKWDDKSKQAVAEQPSIMRDLNQHMESGIYDLVNAEVERQRMFGNLVGMSDLEAYNSVGNAMAQNGMLQGQSQQEAPLNQPSSGTSNTQVTSQQQTNPELKQKRKAAATTKSMPSGQASNQKTNPLSLSDEDFLKQGF